MINMDVLKNFLNQDSIKTVLSKYSNNSFESGFNIFKVLRIKDKEVIICRLLGELLSPNGSHGLGYIPLKLFMDIVLDNKEETEENLKSAQVTLEESVSYDDESQNSYRRVDIVIYIAEKVYPIEVKIWAGDQPKQLFDYYHYYFREEKPENKIYYLTPNGHNPSEYSANGLKQYVTLSFEKDIRDWLIKILELVNPKDENQRKSISIIEQYKEITENMGETERIMLNELKNQISFKEEGNELTIENLEALHFICQQAEEIKKDIETKYLYEYLKCGDEFEKTSVYEDNVPKPDAYKNHARLLITNTKDNDFKIWASVDSVGLYLISNSFIDGWEKDKGCSWFRVKIKDENNQDINVKLDSYKTIEIPISEALNNALISLKSKNE